MTDGENEGVEKARQRRRVRQLIVALLEPENLPVMVEMMGSQPEAREFFARFIVAYAEEYGETASDQLLADLEARFVTPLLEKYPLGPLRGWLSGKIMDPADDLLPEAAIQPILSLLLPDLAEHLGAEELYETLKP